MLQLCRLQCIVSERPSLTIHVHATRSFSDPIKTVVAYWLNCIDWQIDFQNCWTNDSVPLHGQDITKFTPLTGSFSAFSFIYGTVQMHMLSFPTALVWEVMQWPLWLHPFVSTHHFWTEWHLTLTFCMYMGHSCPGIEDQRVKVERCWLTSILSWGQFSTWS